MKNKLRVAAIIIIACIVLSGCSVASPAITGALSELVKNAYSEISIKFTMNYSQQCIKDMDGYMPSQLEFELAGSAAKNFSKYNLKLYMTSSDTERELISYIDGTRDKLNWLGTGNCEALMNLIIYNGYISEELGERFIETWQGKQYITIPVSRLTELIKASTDLEKAYLMFYNENNRLDYSTLLQGIINELGAIEIDNKLFSEITVIDKSAELKYSYEKKPEIESAFLTQIGVLAPKITSRTESFLNSNRGYFEMQYSADYREAADSMKAAGEDTSKLVNQNDYIKTRFNSLLSENKYYGTTVGGSADGHAQELMTRKYSELVDSVKSSVSWKFKYGGTSASVTYTDDQRTGEGDLYRMTAIKVKVSKGNSFTLAAHTTVTMDSLSHDLLREYVSDKTVTEVFIDVNNLTMNLTLEGIDSIPPYDIWGYDSKYIMNQMKSSRSVEEKYIVPVRQICDLMQIPVVWDGAKNKPYIKDENGGKIYIEGALNGEYYMTSLAQMKKAGYAFTEAFGDGLYYSEVHLYR